jgi:hypothetical protein
MERAIICRIVVASSDRIVITVDQSEFISIGLLFLRVVSSQAIDICCKRRMKSAHKVLPRDAINWSIVP